MEISTIFTDWIKKYVWYRIPDIIYYVLNENKMNGIVFLNDEYEYLASLKVMVWWT